MVRSFDYQWNTIEVQPDVHVHEDVAHRGSHAGARRAHGAIRLYFYEHERKVAEHAAALIEAAYRELAKTFHYVPQVTFPYVLYSSYQEFLQTNLFPLQEGVLGVTSPVDLTMALPYFGDETLFARVSTHELAHQFTIQKLRSLNTGDFGADPMRRMPLWFVEGLAEYYAQHGIDAETEMLVRDMVINPSNDAPTLAFFRDDVRNFLWTYKLGQMRCAFLQETYGDGSIQNILRQAGLLVGGDRTRFTGTEFTDYLAYLTGDKVELIERKFDAWLRDRAFRTYVAAAQRDTAMQALDDAEGYVEASTTDPSGQLILYRSVSEASGRRRLLLADVRAPRDLITVATDGEPGTESLHPVSDRNVALHATTLAFIAESESRDVIYWQPLHHEAVRLPQPSEQPERPWQIALELLPRRGFHLAEQGLIAAFSPAFSPDGSRLAFVGLDLQGQRDVYVLTPGEGDAFTLTRLTRDAYAERDVTWGPQGVIFSANATDGRFFNLFVTTADGHGVVRRLTFEARDHRAPLALPDGRVFFVAYDSDGQGNLYLLQNGAVRRCTSIPTALFDPSPGADGGVWALLHRAGRRYPMFLPQQMLRDENAGAPHAQPSQPWWDATLPLDAAVPYDPWTKRAWEPGTVLAMIGAGAGGFFGTVLASAHDTLRNHALILSGSAMGSLQLTDGYLLYVNQEHRTSWALGPFQTLQFRNDLRLQALPTVSAFERFFGGMAMGRFPFNRFFHVQASLQAGAVEYFLDPVAQVFMRDPSANGVDVGQVMEWRGTYGSLRPQVATTVGLGYDTLRLSPLTGPFSGKAWLLELAVFDQPRHHQVFGTTRLDGTYCLPLAEGTTVQARAGVGASWGGSLAHQFYLSSFDTVRAVPHNSSRFLVGREYAFSTVQLLFPLSDVVQIIFLSSLEGVLGIDFGAVGANLRDAWQQRVLGGALGVNVGLGPWVLRVHVAKPFDIGAPLPTPHGAWNTNISLAWLYM